MDASDMSDSSMLVAYFTRTGNTRKVAQEIAELTGAELFEIVPAEAYPGDYQTVVDQAREEIKAGYHPELKNTKDSLDDYDVIFVGSPNWINTIAPPVSSFLAHRDLSARTVVPFMTHGGSGLGHGLADIEGLCPSSVIPEALAIIGSQAAESRKDIRDWLQRIGIPASENRA
jgi:flavodoxin